MDEELARDDSVFILGEEVDSRPDIVPSSVQTRQTSTVNHQKLPFVVLVMLHSRYTFSLKSYTGNAFNSDFLDMQVGDYQGAYKVR